MAVDKLYVSFIWHMHQPYYKDPLTNKAILPWVRLHAIKDYLDMSAFLKPFSQVKAVFNYVPSLLVQIEDYINGNIEDEFYRVSRKPASELTPAEKHFILRNFFMCNWEKMIMPYPRFWEILLKRGRFANDEQITSMLPRFTEKEIRDLQVWFNLTWIGHIPRLEDPFYQMLIDKGEDYSEEEKIQLLDKQIEIMRQVVPLLKKLQDSGQIEISITPYYHPILPLLVSSGEARMALKHDPLPNPYYEHPEDARIQIVRAVEYYEKTFGRKPQGMWPSEGSVSEAVVGLIADAGLQWIATDQEILMESLNLQDQNHGLNLSATELFRPYRVDVDGHAINMVFRDHGLSDKLGFVYGRWKPEDAANDLIFNLHEIAKIMPQGGEPPLISIILDGENAWEYYDNNGYDFFKALYERLAVDTIIQTTTVSDFIANHPPRATLNRLFSGSWINHNFRIWIGHPEDNRAWELLGRARETLVKVQNAEMETKVHWLSPAEQEKRYSQAWEAIYIAEGSDWYWWFGDDHSSANDREFDQLFREHCMNVYRLLDLPIPPDLYQPIKALRAFIPPDQEPIAFLHPVIDGINSNYYEWLSGGHYNFVRGGGAMHQVENLIRDLYYGFDFQQLYLRIDLAKEVMAQKNKLQIRISFVSPREIAIHCQWENNRWRAVLLSTDGEPEIGIAALEETFEIALPFADLGLNVKEQMIFKIAIYKGSELLDTKPSESYLSLHVPDHDWEAMNWCL